MIFQETGMSPTLWIVYSVMIALFIYLGVSILKRGHKRRINQVFFAFLLITAIGLIFNISYRVINDPAYNIIGNMITIFLVDVSLIFLLLFHLIIWKSEKIITDRIKIGVIIFWTVLCSLLFIIDGVTFNAENKPVWPLNFFTHGIIIISALYGLIIFVNVQVYSRFETQDLKKKYLNTIISTTMFFWVSFGNYLANFLNNPIFRDVFTYSAIIVIPGAIMFYIGLKREQ
jgi:hypothetical protein